MSVNFTIKEHRVDGGEECHFSKEIEKEDGPEYQDEVVLRGEIIGISMMVERIEIVERSEHETRQEDDEHLEACIGGGLCRAGGALVCQVEEVLGLAGEEATDVGVGNDSHDERQQ